MPVLQRADRWYGLGAIDPNFYIDTELFAYSGDGIQEQRSRTKRVRGAVWNVGARARQDLITLPDIRQDQTLGVPHPNFSIGGHLIAVMLTGLDHPLNLVPVSKKTNDAMGAVERAIGKLTAAPQWLDIEIPAYYNEDPRIPQGFHYRLFDTTQEPSLSTRLVQEWTVKQEWLHIGQYDYPAADVALVQKLQLGMKLGWKIEDVTSAGRTGCNLTFLAGHLPPVNRRPLAFLDYWLIGYQGLGRVSDSLIGEYVHSIALGAPYSLQWVREFAIKGNILANNNWLTSDAHGKRDTAIELSDSVVTEQHRELLIGGGANAPHVDHIVPESLDGPNCFSNAQITSAQYNVQKGNHTKQFVYRSDEWKADMQKKVAADPLVKFF